MNECNVAMLCGLAGEVTFRVLESGDELASLSVRVPGPGGKHTSVPVVLFNPPSWVEHLDGEAPVVVLGSIQRRFYKLASGATGSSTEVVASAIARVSDARRVVALLRKATMVLDALAA
ncbi:MAG: single-stranded DNA-binding protein [Acidimicrobiia bacterium]